MSDDVARLVGTACNRLQVHPKDLFDFVADATFIAIALFMVAAFATVVYRKVGAPFAPDGEVETAADDSVNPAS